METADQLSPTLQRQTIIALNHLGQSVTSSLELEDVLHRIMAEVTELLHAEGVAVLIPKGDDKLVFAAVCGIGARYLKDKEIPRDAGVVGHVMQTGEAVWLNPEGSNIPGLSVYRQIESVSNFHSESLLAAPILQGGVSVGVLEAAHSRPDGLTPDDLPILSAAANWAAIAITNAQLHRQAQFLREQQAQLEERARLARELHDAVTQLLYSMSVLAGAWRRQIEAGSLAPTVDHIAELGNLANQALREVRLLIYELRPLELEEEGLIGALYRRLETVEQRSGMEARLIVTDEAGRTYPAPVDNRVAMVDFYRLPSSVEQGLYRIAQEALNNAMKHSSATAVCLRLLLGNETISMEIEDNGRGFSMDQPAHPGGFGLVGLQERVQQLGGQLTISSSANQGTLVRIEGVPFRTAAAERVEV